MLVHQIQDSEGVVLEGVKLTNRDILGFRISGTCHAGVQFGSDGVLFKIQSEGGLSAIIGQWLLSGSAASFFLQRTIISGTLEVDAGTGFLQLNANREYDNQKSTAGVKTTVVFFELSSDVSGVPIVDTATMIFECEQGGL